MYEVAVAETKYGVRFFRVSRSEFRSDTCPWCGSRGPDGDRFHLLLEGKSGKPRVWCRSCRKFEWLDSEGGVSQNDRQRIIAEANVRRMELAEAQDAALKRIQAVSDHVLYNHEMKERHIDYWLAQGMNYHTIGERLLGHCDKCPTAPHSSSKTIPVLFRGKLFNIRHRLDSPNGSGKYRPHMAGLPAMLFNADDLAKKSKFGLILEGEKKSLVVSQETGIPNVGIMGMQAFRASWAERFSNWESIGICLDPDADGKSIEIASLFGDRSRIVTLPLKADDFFITGGTKAEFLDFVALARPV